MNTQAFDKITKARSALILDQFFFGSLLLRLKLIEKESIGSMATNGKDLLYSPSFVLKLSLDELKGVLIHEILHCTFEHMARRNNRDHKEWNISTDLAINPIVFDSGFSLPDGILFDSQFIGKSADEIYSIRQATKWIEENENQENQESQGQGEDGQGSDDSQGENGDSDSEGENGDSGNGQGEGEGETQGKGKSGSEGQGEGSKGDSEGQGNGQGNGQGSEGIKEPWNIGECLDSEENGEAIQEWKIATIQAAQQAKALGGHLPGAISRMVEEILHPRIDWKETLQRFISKNARNDYSWSIPNRRHIAQGLYLPGMQSQELGKIVLAIDTSGSVYQKELDQFASELSDILDQFPEVELTVLHCDTAIRNVQELTSNDIPFDFQAIGGGGTDFKPPFTYIEENDLEPICVIYFTDGECYSYPSEPNFPVLWIGTQEFKPMFGEFAYLY